jgi:hypothetical protein
MAINGEQKMIGVTSFFVNQKSRWMDLGLFLDFREGMRSIRLIQMVVN